MRTLHHRRLLTGLLLIASVLTLFLVSIPRVHADDYTSRKIVVFAHATKTAEKEAALSRHGALRVKHLSVVNASVAEMDDATADSLRREPNVLRVEDDAVVYVSQWGWPYPMPYQPAPVDSSHHHSHSTPTAPSTPATPTQPTQVIPWGITKVAAPSVWSKDTGTGVKVGIIDTGIQTDHPDLQANVKGGVNIINSGKSYADDNGHGTHVAGIIAAVNNTIGVVGVAPNVSLYGVKVLDNTGSGYISDIIEGIQWCVNNNIQVINMSLGCSSDIQSLHDACTTANNKGIVIVCAAGNDGTNNSVEYPGAYPECVAVSAVDSNNTIASWSSRGAQVALTAPGVNIYSTYMGSTYEMLSGTSMATPHVTGVAALTIAGGTVTDTNKNGRTNDEVIAKMEARATHLGTAGRNALYGYGLVNAVNSVAP